jgi:hypothetical protein
MLIGWHPVEIASSEINASRQHHNRRGRIDLQQCEKVQLGMD